MKNGLLVFVHPSGWRKPSGLNIKNNSKYKGLYEILTQRNTMIYLNINDIKKGKEIFKCGTRYDYYIVKKEIPSHFKTIISDEDDKMINIDLSVVPFIPNKNINHILKIISINYANNINILKPGSDTRRVRY